MTELSICDEGTQRHLQNKQKKISKLILKPDNYICLVSKFCHTAFNSFDGARKIILRRLALFNGVRVKSGAQCTVGLSIVRPLGSIVRRNSLSK